MKNKLIISDIDQTITVAGIDIWEQITASLVISEKTQDYLDRVNLYKKNSINDPIGESKSMMEFAINLFDTSINANAIYSMGEEKINKLIENNGIRQYSTEFLSEFIEKGGKVILSTANYIDAAFAVRDKLFTNDNIRQNVIVSGSIIDWNKRIVNHINVAKNKIKGILDILNISENELKEQTYMIFGDDPFVNDIALFEINKNKSVLIQTPKNMIADISDIKRSSWEFMYKEIFV